MKRPPFSPGIFIEEKTPDVEILEPAAPSFKDGPEAFFVTYARGQKRAVDSSGKPMDVLPYSLAMKFVRTLQSVMEKHERANMDEMTRARILGDLQQCFVGLYRQGHISQDMYDLFEPYVRWSKYENSVNIGFKIKGTLDEDLHQTAGYPFDSRSFSAEFMESIARPRAEKPSLEKPSIDLESGPEKTVDLRPKQGSGPYFTHDCETCQFVGHIEIAGRKYDAYFCEHAGAPEGGSYLVRWSDDGPDYFSMPAIGLNVIAGDNCSLGLLAAAVCRIHRGEG